MHGIDININIDQIIETYDEIEYYTNNLYIDKSSIEGAGNGVYTNIDLDEGTIIAEYKGLRYRSNEDISEKDMLYAFETTDKITIIPYDDTIARVINDIIDIPGSIQEIKDGGSRVDIENLRYNVDWLLVKNPFNYDKLHRYRVFIITTTYIEEGEELFIDYGPSYWNAILDKLIEASENED